VVVVVAGLVLLALGPQNEDREIFIHGRKLHHPVGKDTVVKAEERKRAAAAQRGVLNKTSKFRGVTKVKGKKARPWQASKDNVHRERAEASSSWQGHGGEGVGPAGGARSCSGSTAPSSATTASNMVVVVVAGLVLLALGPQKICGLPVPVPVGQVECFRQKGPNTGER